jgi:hypothetical protein
MNLELKTRREWDLPISRFAIYLNSFFLICPDLKERFALDFRRRGYKRNL